VSDFSGDWQTWRDTREQRLRDPQGWLAITAIHWLSDVPERFDDVPGEWSGEWSGDVGRATVTLTADETLHTASGTLTPGTHHLGPLDGAGVTVAFDDAVAQVADREGRVIVRPRHPDSPNLRAYAGTPCYPADPSWVVPARFVPYAERDDDAVGEVVLARDGAEHRLVAWAADHDGLWILFRDATSGVTTYPANRQLVTDAPSPDGDLRIDFNRAYNMPCAYTDFATCPLPPATNTLPFAVEAGEKTPARSSDGGRLP
jgi:uncharacterized protein (DUF1684 family)